MTEDTRQGIIDQLTQFVDIVMVKIVEIERRIDELEYKFPLDRGIQKKMQLDDRIKAIEEKLDAVMKHREQQVVAPHTLACKSPNGKYSVTIMCQDDMAGILINGPTHKDPFVAIYTNDSQGAAVGVYGKKREGGNLVCDAAIAADDKGGQLQLTDENNNVHSFGPKAS